MSSIYFRIEIYGKSSYGCPEFDLMGYNNINELIEDCWDYYYQTYSEEEQNKQ